MITGADVGAEQGEEGGAGVRRMNEVVKNHAHVRMR